MRATPTLTPASTAAQREKLKWLRSRYDDGTISPAGFAVIRKLESDLAWAEHKAARS
jgi:hypothetical protein